MCAFIITKPRKNKSARIGKTSISNSLQMERKSNLHKTIGISSKDIITVHQKPLQKLFGSTPSSRAGKMREQPRNEEKSQSSVQRVQEEKIKKGTIDPLHLPKPPKKLISTRPQHFQTQVLRMLCFLILGTTIKSLEKERTKRVANIRFTHLSTRFIHSYHNDLYSIAVDSIGSCTPSPKLSTTTASSAF